MGSPDVPPLYVSAMGVTVEIEAPDLPTRDRLAGQWSRALTAEPAEPAVSKIAALEVGPGEQVAADYALTSQVTLAALHGTAGRRLNLHAGGVADQQGRVLGLVAASGTGKTTATLLLARRLGYVSDETLSVDPEGFVHPYAKPLSVIVDRDRPREKMQQSPDALGLGPTPATATLHRMVVLRRDRPGSPHADRGLVRLPWTEAVLELIEQSSSVQSLPRPLATVLDLIGRCGGVYALHYDEIESHVDELLNLLATEPDAAEQVVPRLEQLDLSRDAPRPTSREPVDIEGIVQRSAAVDAVLVDDELVLLTSSRAWLLGEITATLWLFLDRPRSFGDLLGEAERVHGPHPDSRTIVLTALERLRREDLLAGETRA